MHEVLRRQKLVALPEPPGRTRMSTGDDGARLQRQAGWRLVSNVAPYREDSCIYKNAQLVIYAFRYMYMHTPVWVLQQRRDMVVFTRSSRKTSNSIDDRLYTLKVTIGNETSKNIMSIYHLTSNNQQSF